MLFVMRPQSPKFADGIQPTSQQQYQAYPGGAAPQQPQYPGQQSYGGPPVPNRPGAQSYGAPPAALIPAGAFKQSLEQTIREKNVQSMFPNPAVLDQICQGAPAKVEQLCQQWRVPREVGQDIVKLALFDIILFIGIPPPTYEKITG
jgi:hypothetical protein